VNIPGTHDKIGEVFFLECGEVLFEAFFQGFWQRDDAVFSAFAIVDGDGSLPEIEVLDADLEFLHYLKFISRSGTPGAQEVHDDLSASYPAGRRGNGEGNPPA
jgi:hypothetical protein